MAARKATGAAKLTEAEALAALGADAMLLEPRRARRRRRPPRSRSRLLQVDSLAVVGGEFQEIAHASAPSGYGVHANGCPTDSAAAPARSRAS